MPVRDFECLACSAIEEDVFMRRADDPPPPCPSCGSQRKQLVSKFAVPFSGSLRKYSDPNREGGRIDGFWSYRKRSSISGQPEPVFLDSMQAVCEFNKAEGLSAPGEVPTNSTVTADGKRILSDGMPGQWVRGGSVPSIPARLREMLAKPDSEFHAPAATAVPCMPMGHGISVEAVDALPEMAG
jgi:putative FmdB family regulatory protein